MQVEEKINDDLERECWITSNTFPPSTWGTNLSVQVPVNGREAGGQASGREGSGVFMLPLTAKFRGLAAPLC